MEDSERIRLNAAAIDLLVCIGLVASVIERFPEHVQENFEEKIRTLRHNLEREQAEFIEFGEAFDED